jgi:hypothetical protein
VKFVPFHELSAPNIVADGPAGEGTVLVLSHWPAAPTPLALRADLSAQIVFRHLGSPKHHVAADVVSNNHFDEDGLVSVFSLLRPDVAEPRRPFFEAVAWAGDFQQVRSREAARVAWTINAFADPERSPLGAGAFKGPYAGTCAALYAEGLAKLPEIVAHPDRFKALWEVDDAFFDESERAIASGRVTIDERPALDLAVVRGRAHPCSIYTRLSTHRVARIDGARYEFQYRYESWVRFVSRPIAPRVDLRPLAERLNALDPGWEYEGNDQTTPRLHRPDGSESRLTAEAWLAMVEGILRRAIA